MRSNPARNTFITRTSALVVLLCSTTARADLPKMAWGTYVGGDGDEYAGTVAVGAAGDVFFCGETSSASGISTPGAHQEMHGGALFDAYLARFTPEGARVWSTYVGGEGDDSCRDLAVDSAGNVYLSGLTSSATKIATPDAVQPTVSGGYDGFVAKFDPDGARLWGTYTGGGIAQSLAIGPDDALHVVGEATQLLPFPLPNAHDPAFSGGRDAFVLKFDADGELLWGTHYGGAADERRTAVAVDGDSVYLAGQTHSATDIASDGAHDTSLDGMDGFIVRFDPAGARAWATYYGGESDDHTIAAAVTPDGGIAASGRTKSTQNVATPGVHQVANAGGFDAMIVRFDAAGQRVWATYFGGTGLETVVSLAADPTGNLLLAGFSGSTAGIATPNAHKTFLSGANDVFVAKFDPAGGLRWGTYLGGDGNESSMVCWDGCNMVAPHGLDAVYVAGRAHSYPGFSTPDALYHPVPSLGYDNFLVRLSQGQGDPCAADDECEAGFCVDGVCCDSPCAEGTCASGVCVPARADTTGDMSEGTGVPSTSDATADTGDTTLDTTTAATTVDTTTADTTGAFDVTGTPPADTTGQASDPAPTSSTGDDEATGDGTTAAGPSSTGIDAGGPPTTTADPPADSSSGGPKHDDAGAPGCACDARPAAPGGLLALAPLLFAPAIRRPHARPHRGIA